MKIKALVLVGALALGGCQTVETIGGFAVSQGQVDTLRSTYDGVLSTAVSYRELGYCKTGTSFTAALPCADRKIVAELQSDNAAIIQEFNVLQTAVTNGDNTGALAAYSTAQGLIATIKSVVASAQGAK